MCNNSGSVAVPQKNIMAVKGESIVLQCLFRGNLEVLSSSMSSYWIVPIDYYYLKPTYITDNSTDPYHISIYQTCLSKDGSCCNFTNQLYISKVPWYFDDVYLTCGVVIDEVSYSHPTKLSKYFCI